MNPTDEATADALLALRPMEPTPEPEYTLVAAAASFDKDGAPIGPVLGYARVNDVHARRIVQMGGQP